jgi:L-seryl-tRNA(Ser) seleniumtransferase
MAEGTLSKMEASAGIRRQTLRELPAVEVLAGRAEGIPRAQAISAARLAIEAARQRVLAGEDVDLSFAALDAELAARAKEIASSSLRPVINATGVILHTNLGRAPLAPEAAEAAALVAVSYTNLEYDLESGERGSRHIHLERGLLQLSGAESAIAVNNNAAAVLLALASLGEGEVIVSRGQLLEIGGSFRIPEILAQSGLDLVEVGTTNRTRLDDYRAAIGPKTAALMRVHQSNFRLHGFTEEVPLGELCELAAEHRVPLVDDLGSGAVEPIADEPTLVESVRAGATLVCCSADKLLGGPQAGLIFGATRAVERCGRHPLARALRLDKMQLAALEATLRLRQMGGVEGIPVQAMLNASGAALQDRAAALARDIGPSAEVIEASALPGGGSLPDFELQGPVCAVQPGSGGADALAARLRKGEPPVVVRISSSRVLLDPRTISETALAPLAEAVKAALGEE